MKSTRHRAAGWPMCMSKPFAAKGVGPCFLVDFHTWALLKGVAISTLLGVGSNVTFGGESDLVQAIRESTQQNVSRAGDQLTSRNLQIQPTITIRPGAPVRLIVHRDLILAPWRG
jgi:type IV secretion system protein VirB10